MLLWQWRAHSAALHTSLTAGRACPQVASPLVYRLAKHVVLTNVRHEGTELNRRYYSRALYGDVQARIATFLDLQPQSECMTV